MKGAYFVAACALILLFFCFGAHVPRREPCASDLDAYSQLKTKSKFTDGGMLHAPAYVRWADRKSLFVNELHRLFRVNCICNKGLFGSMHKDGYKVACKNFIPAGDCVVYSLGSFGNFDFESSVHEEYPKCQITTVDRDEYPRPPFVQFVTTWVGNKGMSLNDIRSKYNDKKRINFLKVDIELGEWDILEEIFNGESVDQVGIEIHGLTVTRLDRLARAVDASFCLADVNPNVGCYDCIELLFVNKKLF